MKKNKFIKSFSVYNLILIAMLTAVSIAFKVVIVSLVQPITRSIGIPGGAPVGGLYMFWLPLAIALTDKHGGAFLISLLQALVLLITGMPGTHGIWNMFTYLLPGIVVEIVFFFKSKKKYNIYKFMIATALANIVGVYGSNLLFFRLEPIPLLFTLLVAILSGIIGGIIGYFTYKKIEDTGVLNKFKGKKSKKHKVENNANICENINDNEINNKNIIENKTTVNINEISKNEVDIIENNSDNLNKQQKNN